MTSRRIRSGSTFRASSIASRPLAAKASVKPWPRSNDSSAPWQRARRRRSRSRRALHWPRFAPRLWPARPGGPRALVDRGDSTPEPPSRVPGPSRSWYALASSSLRRGLSPAVCPDGAVGWQSGGEDRSPGLALPSHVPKKRSPLIWLPGEPIRNFLPVMPLYHMQIPLLWIRVIIGEAGHRCRRTDRRTPTMRSHQEDSDDKGLVSVDAHPRDCGGGNDSGPVHWRATYH